MSFKMKETILNKSPKDNYKIKPSLSTRKSTLTKSEDQNNDMAEKTKKKPLFCSDCELELFWLSDMASNKKGVQEYHNNCAKEGKFNSQYCSRLFISGIYNEKSLKRKK
jgi:hypothetical protein